MPASGDGRLEVFVFLISFGDVGPANARRHGRADRDAHRIPATAYAQTLCHIAFQTIVHLKQNTYF